MGRNTVSKEILVYLGLLRYVAKISDDQLEVETLSFTEVNWGIKNRLISKLVIVQTYWVTKVHACAIIFTAIKLHSKGYSYWNTKLLPCVFLLLMSNNSHCHLYCICRYLKTIRPTVRCILAFTGGLFCCL